MGRYFDTATAAATLATSATELANFCDLSQESQKSQKSQAIEGAKLSGENIIDLRHAFEERAAIMEFDGDMSRTDAERAAAADTGFDPDGA